MNTLARRNLVTYIALCIVLSLRMGGPAFADVLVDANLVGYWQFEGDVNDNSGYENHGTLYGDASVSKGVLQLDASYDYVNVGDRSSLDLTSRGTITAWVYVDGAPATWAIVAMKHNFANFDGYGLYFDTTKLRGITASSSSKSTSYSTTTISGGFLRNWKFVAFTWDSSNQTLYVDGIQEDQDNSVTCTPSGYPFRIGYDYAVSLDGKIDDVRVYNIALSDWEIRKLYNYSNKSYSQLSQFLTSVRIGNMAV